MRMTLHKLMRKCVLICFSLSRPKQDSELKPELELDIFWQKACVQIRNLTKFVYLFIVLDLIPRTGRQEVLCYGKGDCSIWSL